jgi:small subunit ribosomal protein S6
MPENNRVYAYEVMFLIGQAQAADLAGVIEHINEIFHRSGAEVIAMRKWDERRLAYEIKKQKRGLYILAYVKIPARNMPLFERDCNLSERLLRVMSLRADHLTEDEMRAADAREDLAVEARMRATRAIEGQEPDEEPEPVAIAEADDLMEDEEE